jgi:hypothetical protein
MLIGLWNGGYNVTGVENLLFENVNEGKVIRVKIGQIML